MHSRSCASCRLRPRRCCLLLLQSSQPLTYQHRSLWSRRVQDLLRHTVPNGDPAVIFERALRLLIADLERTRMGKVEHPRGARGAKKASRHIPAAIRRAVWQRDDGRCAFRGPHGRCAETGFLEYHHVVPFADGGETSPGNLELRCRSHNEHEANLWFGAAQPPLVRETRAMFGT